jgi:single-strand DNA-binding protein
MLNKCMFIGNLGKDPEVRSMQNGDKVANLSLGVSEKWKDKATGEKKERTEWVRVTIFGQLAEVAERYLKKGSKVYICGQMQTRKWTDKDGADKYSTEIVLQGFRAELLMLDGKQSAGDDTPVADRGRATSRSDMDDEIPF